MVKYELILLCCICTPINVGGLHCANVSNHPSLGLLPRKPQCGHSGWIRPYPTLGAPITQSDLGEFPWLVSIQFKRKARFAKHPKWEHAGLCTGSLINNIYVITAARCVNLSTSYNHQALVKIGDWKVTSPGRDCQGNRCAPISQAHVATRMIRHQNFYPADGKDTNDVLLLKLIQRVQFNDYVQPICLPLPCYWQSKPLDCYEMTVAGWGFKDERGTPDKMLVDIRDQDLCARRLYAESQFCATRLRLETNCKGDPGSPVMYRDTIRGRPTWYLIGMAGEWACERGGYFYHSTVLTRVGSFSQWILDQITA